MSTHSTATFGIKAWDEKPWFEDDGGRKLTRATVIKTYSGDLDGEGTMEYVMTYSDEKTATYVGLERVVGRLGDREGSFVMKDVGTFKDGVAASAFEIVPGSGTGDLAGLSGNARVDAVHADTQEMSLDYDLD